MKKKLFLFAIATACLALIVGGCKKYGDENHSEPADISLLTNQWASSIAIGESATDILFDVNVPNSRIAVGIMNDAIKAAFEEAGMTVTDKTYEYVAEYEITDIDAEAGVIYCSSIVKDENSAPKSAAPDDQGSAGIPTGDVQVMFSNLTATSVTLTYNMMPFLCTATSGAEIVSVPAEPDVPSPALSIEKQWVCETSEAKQCFDIGFSNENGILIGQYTDMYATMLPEGADPEKSYISMVMEADKIKSITPDTDDPTSGVVIFETDPYADGSTEECKIEYSNLTAESVTIVYTDAMQNVSDPLDCTLAPEGTKVYTYADLM